ncbi:MAG: hypothetical protein PV344_05465 [Anaplasma sp.]|nr:hypothetical protein [Anaplasma sp.]
MLRYCPNCSRDLFFANRRRFAKFVKIRSSRKFSRLQYMLFMPKNKKKSTNCHV